LFEEWERARNFTVNSHLLSVHLAANHLSPNGYVTFNASAEAFSGSKLNMVTKEKSPVKVKTPLAEFLGDAIITK